MNKQITTTKQSQIIFIDLHIGQRDEISAPMQRAMDYKLKKTDNDTFYNHPLYNRLDAISLAYINKGKVKVKIIQGTEKEILEQFHGLGLQSRVVCGWNVKGYKLPWLRHKFLAHGMVNEYMEYNFNDSGKKPWDLDKVVIDLMTTVSGALYSSLSFEEACVLMGLESIAYPSQNLDVENLTNRIYNLVLLYLRLRDEEDMEVELVDGGIDKMPVLQRLLMQDSILDKDIEELKHIMDNMEDKTITFEIFKAAVAKGKVREDKRKFKKLQESL